MKACDAQVYGTLRLTVSLRVIPLAVLAGLLAACATVTPVDTEYLRARFRAVADDLPLFAHLAQVAYSDPPLEPGYERFEVPVPEGLPQKAVYVVWTDHDRKVQYIAIRGTANVEDLRTDLKAEMVRDPQLDLPVHRGFRNLAHAIYGDLIAHDRLNPEYAIALTGHSLGGAAAVIVAMYLRTNALYAKKIVKVMTFGQPKFTSNEGVHAFQELNERIVRIVGCDDVIPFLPPPRWFSFLPDSYEHKGTVFVLLDHTYFDYLDSGDIERPFVKSLRDDFDAAVNDRTLFYSHRIARYIMRIADKRDGYDPVSYDRKTEALCRASAQ